MQGPFQGIRVVDLSVAISGPLAVGILADQGAEVIKVEQPGIGDIARYVGVTHGGISAMFQHANRGKRSVALDLRQLEGVEVLLELCRGVDVFVQNFRPGVAERMGIGEAQVREVSPGVIYVSITGFGSRGPDATRRVYDNVVQAKSGLAATQTGPGGEPQFIRQLAADKITSLAAAQAIAAALFARERGRGGQHVELAMLDAVIAFLWVDCAGNETLLDNTAGLPSSAAGTMSFIRFADGWGTATPLSDAEFHGLARAFGIDSSAPELATVADRMANRDAMSALLGQVYEVAARTATGEALARMEAHDVPCGRAVPVADLADDPQVAANGLLDVAEHPAAGRVRQCRTPARFSATPAGHGPASPTLGQHTVEVLTGAGLGDRVASLRSAGVIP